MAQVSLTLTLGSAATPLVSERTFLSYLRIENEAGNNPVYVGDSSVTNSNYGASVLAEASGYTNALELGPFPTAPIHAHDVYLYGTVGQKVHVLMVMH